MPKKIAVLTSRDKDEISDLHESIIENEILKELSKLLGFTIHKEENVDTKYICKIDISFDHENYVLLIKSSIILRETSVELVNDLVYPKRNIEEIKEASRKMGATLKLEFNKLK